MTTPVRPEDPPVAEPGKRRSGATVGGISSTDDAATKAEDDDEDEWRHPPVAPVDESNPLRSLGKAISDTVTGSDAAPVDKPKR